MISERLEVDPYAVGSRSDLYGDLMPLTPTDEAVSSRGSHSGQNDLSRPQSFAVLECHSAEIRKVANEQ